MTATFYLYKLRAVTAAMVPREASGSPESIEDWLIENDYRPPSNNAAYWSILSQQSLRLFKVASRVPAK